MCVNNVHRKIEILYQMFQFKIVIFQTKRNENKW